MKTVSVRAKEEDAQLLKTTCWELSAKLQRQVNVSELIHGLMENLDSAKERIENTSEQAS
jgi:hypothetical protein